ncbi:MAG: transporter associated domain-containing protein, partial [Bacteroidota bacterium]
EEFQQRRKHIAIVVGRDGKYSGLVTLEDIVEEIVGDIDDEFDDEEVIYSKIDDRNYIFEARTALSDVEKVIGAEPGSLADQYPDFSLSALVRELTGRIPGKMETIGFHNLVLTIEAADKRQIKRIKITVNK